MTKFFKESNKPYLDRNEFFWKKELCQFLDIPIIYHCTNYWAISEKNTELTDGQMDIWTDRQTETTVLDS